MAINNITQTISELPAPPHRGIDVQTLFVTKQEDFQDHLQGTTVTELNTLKDQLNTRIGEINSTVTTMNGYADTASAGASTATTKAGEASTSASGALTSRNQAETFKNNASTSASTASQWADNNYNVEVETGKYSAKHWSTVAENATSGKMDKVTSTDNAIVRFDGTTGDVQNSSILIDDNGNLNITGTDKRITGDFSNATFSKRVAFQTSTVNGNTIVSVAPNGTGTATAIDLYNNSSINAKGQIGCNASEVFLRSGDNGVPEFLPITFKIGEAERMRIDTSGNVLVTGSGALGYGTGSGGTVTQDTNKNFKVTLNKPTGTITTSNSTLVAGQGAFFSFLNSLININDNLKLTPKGVVNYDIDVIDIYNGAAIIRIINKDTISHSDAIAINFSLEKGAIS